MNELQEWELYLLSDMIPWANKSAYEQTRLLMWSFLSPYFKKGQGKKPNEILPLVTDRDHVPHYTEEQVDEFRNIVKKLKF